MRSRHDRVLELLPWLVNGTLDDDDANEVRRHLSECAECRAQLETLRELGDSVRNAPRPEIDAESGLEAMRRRLDERSEASSSESWRASPRVLRRIVLAQAAALALAVGVIFLQPSNAPRPPTPFRTLSDPSPRSIAEPGPSPSRAKILFAESSTEGEIRRLLGRVGARVVDGPSAMGLYVIELGATPEDRELLGARIAILRAAGHVRFVELADAERPSLPGE